MFALTNCRLYQGDVCRDDQAIWIHNQVIHRLIPLAQLPPDVPQVDCQGAYVTPGFIDLQLNGCGGVLFNDAITADTLDTMHRTNLKSGTTSFLPTLITTSDEAMQAAMELVQTYRQSHPYRVLGLHLEGPYLNPKRKGIHDERYIRQSDTSLLKTIASYGPDTVKIVTLAPEQVTAEQIALLTDAGIVVSAGHTQATFEAAMAGFDAGVGMATHLFNAMSPWQGREPGMVGAVFSRPAVYAGIIADGHHVHFDSIRLAKQLKQDKLLLVTDATPPAGTQMDSFWLGGQEVLYREGKCVSAEGTLGGSALTLIEAVANCVRHVGMPLPEALRMASLYPAQAIGYDHKLGKLAPGYLANLTLFNPQFNVLGIVEQGVLQVFRQGFSNPS